HSIHLSLLFFFSNTPPPPRSTLFPYTTLFRSREGRGGPPGCEPRSPGVRGRARGSDRGARRVRGGPGLRAPWRRWRGAGHARGEDRKSTRLNSSHLVISYAVFCLKKKIIIHCR